MRTASWRQKSQGPIVERQEELFRRDEVQISEIHPTFGCTQEDE